MLRIELAIIISTHKLHWVLLHFTQPRGTRLRPMEFRDCLKKSNKLRGLLNAIPGGRGITAFKATYNDNGRVYQLASAL